MGTVRVGIDIAVCARPQFGRDLGRRASPPVQPRHHVVDGRAERFAVRGMHPSGNGSVKPHSAQAISYSGLDHLGGSVILARGPQHRRNVDPGDVRFSHISLGRSPSQSGSAGFSPVR